MSTTSLSATKTPPIVFLRERLEARAAELDAALPPDISRAQFIRAVLTAAQINPDIQACSWQSLWLACLQACRDGLLPDGIEGAIVPYKDRATWVPMYQGLLRRFRRSGQFRWITAGLARKGEPFRHYIDESGEHFLHEPGNDGDAPIERVYALATTKDGGIFVTVMSIAEADKIRAFSKNRRDDGPWKVWPEAMLKKTAIKQLSKYLPAARDLVPPSDREDDEPPFADDPPTPLPAARRTTRERIEDIAEQTPASAEPAAQADADGGAAAEARSTEPQQLQLREGKEGDLVTVAYERGKRWREAGNSRKAMPGEYRSDEREAEAAAWSAGFDGDPQPEA